MLTIKTVLLSLQSLLAAPEPNDPQDAQVAHMLLERPELFDAKAREWTKRYAGAGAGDSSLSEEERRSRELDGFTEELVAQFTGMGFETRAVVVALRNVGVRPGMLAASDEQATRVVEVLIAGLGH